jgi:hypothetical protein
MFNSNGNGSCCPGISRFCCHPRTFPGPAAKQPDVGGDDKQEKERLSDSAGAAAAAAAAAAAKGGAVERIGVRFASAANADTAILSLRATTP